jgi:hypothetical protein
MNEYTREDFHFPKDRTSFLRRGSAHFYSYSACKLQFVGMKVTHEKEGVDERERGSVCGKENRRENGSDTLGNKKRETRVRVLGCIYI